MDNRFPVLDITKEAIKLPLSNGKDVAKGLGIIFGSVLIGALAMLAMLLISSPDAAAMQNIQHLMTTGEMVGDGGSLVLILVAYLLLLVFMMSGMTHVFNYWVRLAAFGREEAKFPSFKKALSAALVNMIKFLLIGILIVIITFVVNSVLSMLGLGPSFGEQMQASAQSGIADQYREGSLSTLIMAIVSCFVYSMCSANLTQTALGSEREGLEHPHTMDFAIVLILIYALLIVPTIFAAYAGLSSVVMAIQVVIGFYILFTAAVAHGLRYRVCIAEKGPEAEIAE